LHFKPRGHEAHCCPIVETITKLASSEARFFYADGNLDSECFLVTSVQTDRPEAPAVSTVQTRLPWRCVWQMPTVSSNTWGQSNYSDPIFYIKSHKKLSAALFIPDRISNAITFGFPTFHCFHVACPLTFTLPFCANFSQ